MIVGVDYLLVGYVGGCCFGCIVVCCGGFGFSCCGFGCWGFPLGWVCRCCGLGRICYDLLLCVLVSVGCSNIVSRFLSFGFVVGVWLVVGLVAVLWFW